MFLDILKTLDDLSEVIPLLLLGVTILGIIIGRFVYGISFLQTLEKISNEQKEYRRKNSQSEILFTIAARHILLGNEFLGIGNLTAAKIEFKAALQYDSANNEAALGLFKSQILDHIENYGYSPELVKKKIDLLFKYNDTDAHGFYFLGMLYRHIDYKTSLKYFNDAIVSNPYFPDAYYHIASIYDFEEEFDSNTAIPYYEKALEQSEFNQKYLNNIAYHYMHNNMYDKAIPKYETLIKIDKNDLIPYLMLSYCLLLTGKVKDSIKVINKYNLIIEKDPKVLEAPLNNSAWHFSSTNNSKIKLDTSQMKLFYGYMSSYYKNIIAGFEDKAKIQINKAREIYLNEQEDLNPVIDLIDFEIKECITKGIQNSNISLDKTNIQHLLAIKPAANKNIAANGAETAQHQQ